MRLKEFSFKFRDVTTSGLSKIIGCAVRGALATRGPLHHRTKHSHKGQSKQYGSRVRAWSMCAHSFRPKIGAI